MPLPIWRREGGGNITTDPTLLKILKGYDGQFYRNMKITWMYKFLEKHKLKNEYKKKYKI